MENPWARPPADAGFLPPAPERPAYVFARMVGWILAGMFAVALIAFVLTIIARGVTGGDGSAAVPPIITVASGFALQTIFLWGAFRRAKVTGWRGDITDGFGFYRPRRWGLLLALAALILIINGLWWTWRIATPRPQWSPNVLTTEQAFASATFAAHPSLFVLMTLLGPVAEELFFRGWLWTALRRFWMPLPVMIATGSSWVGMHMLDDIQTARRLIPLAIVLSLARHFCGSVGATIGLHALNNVFVAVALLSFYGRW